MGRLQHILLKMIVLQSRTQLPHIASGGLLCQRIMKIQTKFTHNSAFEAL